MQRIAGMIVLFFGLFAAPTFAQRFVVFPQFASGQGWTSDLYFTNQGLSDVFDITIRFYDNSGEAQAVPTSLGTGSSFLIDLAAGATQTIQLTSSVSFLEGYIVVEYPSAVNPIRATEVYRYEQGGVVQVEVGVPQQEFANHFSFPVEINSSEGIRTAIALVNPAEYNPGSPVSQTVILNLIGTNGTIQSTVKVPLPSGQHLADYLDETGFFEDLDNFVGSLSISSPLGIGVLALRQDNQAFGAIATDYGPILAPFALSSVVTPLPEPNDTPAQAPSIVNSIVLSGYMSSSSDVDSVSYMGSSGEVISIICRTTGIGSHMDPVLQVYDSALNLIAENDDNGLSPALRPSSESFIEMELPADDTYYFVVYDYYGNYGPDINYILHVKLP